MAAIRSKDTQPEVAVRSIVHALGFRFRLHDPKLPGKPDLVFRSRSKVIFVHGCFWHNHTGCRRATLPKTRAKFWVNKLELNKKRDRNTQRLLRKMGWSTLVIWQCELKHVEKLKERISEFLAS